MSIKPINLYWPYSHTNGISDQLWCIKQILASHGAPFTLSRNLDISALNIFIENSSEQAIREISVFAKNHKKKIVVIPTEFLNLTQTGGFHSINTDTAVNTPQCPNSMVTRINRLSEIRDFVSAFISLGGQPSLGTYGQFYGVRRVFSLGLPDFNFCIQKIGQGTKKLYFSGSRSLYRAVAVKELQERFSVLAQYEFVPESQRIAELDTCDLNLNIPQTANWTWLSTMRVLFGLRCGRLTLHYGTLPKTAFSQFVIPFDKTTTIEDVTDACSELEGFQGSMIDLDQNWREAQAEFLNFVNNSC